MSEFTGGWNLGWKNLNRSRLAGLLLSCCGCLTVSCFQQSQVELNVRIQTFLEFTGYRHVCLFGAQFPHEGLCPIILHAVKYTKAKMRTHIGFVVSAMAWQHWIDLTAASHQVCSIVSEMPWRVAVLSVTIRHQVGRCAQESSGAWSQAWMGAETAGLTPVNQLKGERVNAYLLF